MGANVLAQPSSELHQVGISKWWNYFSKQVLGPAPRMIMVKSQW
jgi:hypothetical protein